MITIDGLDGVDPNPMTQGISHPSVLQGLGLSRGALGAPFGYPGGWTYNAVATNGRGTSYFWPGTSNNQKSGTDMLFCFGQQVVNSLGVRKIVFTPDFSAGYSWEAF